MTIKQTIVAAVLATLLLAAIPSVAPADYDAHADEATGSPVSEAGTVADGAAERSLHEADRAHAAQLAEALASLREADAARAAQAEALAQAEAEAQAEAARQAAPTEARGASAQADAFEAPDFKSAGVIYGEDGTRYTWYSERVLPGAGLAELNANGRHVDGSGYVVDADGYIALASGSHAKGEVLETPVGAGKVYDYCPTPGTIDVYTAW